MASTGEPFGLFWDSENGDRTYSAASFEYWLKKFFTSGVFNGDLQVQATSGMTVKVGAGYANVDGKVKFWNAEFNLTLSAANSTYPRIDTIVITRDNVNRQITCEVVTGAYTADEPQPTAPVRNPEIYQLVLAQIYVAAGATGITQSDITDTRPNPNLCGYITGTVTEMDYSQFAAQFAAYYNEFKTGHEADFDEWSTQQTTQFNQWSAQQTANFETWETETKDGFVNWMQGEKADFDEWFTNLVYVLDGDVAGHLQNEIDEIKDASSGSIFSIHTDETALYNKDVTLAAGSQTKTATFNSYGEATISGITNVGDITITSTSGTDTAGTTFTIPYYSKYRVNLNFWTATVNLTTSSSELYGSVISVYKDNTKIGETSFSSEGVCTYKAKAAGAYVFSVIYNGQEYSASLNITEETVYTATIDTWTARINIITPNSQLYGKTITVTKGSELVGTADFSSSGEALFIVHEAGTYTFSADY